MIDALMHVGISLIFATADPISQDREIQRIPADRFPVVTGQGFFPVICKMRDSHLGVVLRGGAPHVGVGGRLDFVASADGGRTWSKPVAVADNPPDARNPAFGQAADGTLVCLYHVQPNYDEKGQYKPSMNRPIPIYVVRSADGGRIWSKPTHVDQRPLGWGSPYGKILTMPDNSMLANIYGGYVPLPGDADQKPDKKRNCSYLFRSTDHGKTWTFFSRIAAGYNETGLAQRPDGRLLAALRTEAERVDAAVAISHSDDNGRTWSPPRLMTQTSQHPADLLVLSQDRVLMTYGHRLPPQGVRGILSTDGGKTFPTKREFVLVDTATSFDCGYPSSALLDANKVITVYYSVTNTAHPDRGIHCGAVMYSLPQ